MALMPSDAILLGAAVTEPWKYELYGLTPLAEEAADAFGCILLGYGEVWQDAAVKYATNAGNEALYDLTLLVPMLGLKGAAKKNVLKLAEPWQELRACPDAEADGSLHWAGSMLAHLTDDHDWTREQCAAWLAGAGL